MFTLTEEAAQHNMQLLQRHDNSIQKLIEAYPGSFISPGSEFQPVHLLDQLFVHHHNWPIIQNILTQGSLWPLLPISEVERITKNNEFIQRGNHKLAVKYKEDYLNIIQTEMDQGWVFPLPITYINCLHHGELAPVGIDDKVWTLNPDGSKKVKLRLTHDQSFEASSGKSVNSRVIKEDLPPLFYGGCLSRLIHYIVDVRLRHPAIPILGGKSDFKAAYRRVSLHGDTAAKCSIMYEKFTIPSTRLTFGGSPCLTHFCPFSKICADLANDLLHCEAWDPTILRSPNDTKLGEASIQDFSIPFAPAKNLDVALEPDDFGKIDIFIDDGLAITPDINKNRFRAIQALLLAIHVLCRPVDQLEPIKREGCLSLAKLEEEGSLSEKFTFLSWDIDTRSITMALPNKKFARWSSDIQKIISSKKVSYANLESVLGRLNHAASAYPIMRYFLSKIRIVITNWDVSRTTKKVTRYLTSQVIKDLRLWHNVFLPAISRGMSLNLITFRRPSYMGWSDACPHGLGGFDYLGNAWRLAIPPEFKQAMEHKNNCLEFLASFFTIWQSILMGWSKLEECFLVLGDNSSAVGWLHKASVDPSKDSPLFMATRKFAEVMITEKACIYSQHIPGVSNKIADALSRHFDLSDAQLTNYILSSYSSQVSSSFRIYQVHQEITCWMTCWLQKCSETRGLQKILKTRNAECIKDGLLTQTPLGLQGMYGYPAYPLNTESTSSEHLQQLYDGENFLNLTQNAWLRQRYKRPWQNWVRSLGQTWGTTSHMELDQTPCTYLPDSSEECGI
jgi:hypothetical protein